jgi:hypothetical protein
MTQLYATLGALVMLPIVLNIFVITISYYFAATPIITGLLLLSNIFLIFWDYQKLLPIFRISKTQYNETAFTNRKIESDILWFYLGIVLFTVTVMYVLFFERTPIYWILTCVMLGLAGLILFNKKKLPLLPE